MEHVRDHECLEDGEVPWGVDATCENMGMQQSEEDLMAVADYITQYATQIDENINEPTVDEIGIGDGVGVVRSVSTAF